VLQGGFLAGSELLPELCVFHGAGKIGKTGKYKPF